MKVKFVLQMEELKVNNKEVDFIEIEWQEDLSQEAILNISHKWITEKKFLTSRMNGLTGVKESSLTIEPLS